MGILKIKILAEDIRQDNYIDSDACPITKALARAGRPDLKECGGIYKRQPDGTRDTLREVLNDSSYTELLVKMFSMFKTLRPDAYLDLVAIPIADIDWEFNIPDEYDAVLVIDEATIKATQVEFVAK